VAAYDNPTQAGDGFGGDGVVALSHAADPRAHQRGDKLSRIPDSAMSPGRIQRILGPKGR
jgi:hypothetical protein